MALAIPLVEAALRHQGPGGGAGCDAWDLAAEGGQVWARRRQHGLRLRQKPRRRETARLPLRDVKGWAMPLPRPHRAVGARVPRIPAPA
jgi:hypothetical protein